MAIRLLAEMCAVLPRSVDLYLLASSAGAAGDEKGALASVISGAAEYTFQTAEQGAVAAILRRARAGSLKSAKNTAHDITGVLHFSSPLAGLTFRPIDAGVRLFEMKQHKELFSWMYTKEADDYIAAFPSESFTIGPFGWTKAVGAYFATSLAQASYRSASARDERVSTFTAAYNVGMPPNKMLNKSRMVRQPRGGFSTRSRRPAGGGGGGGGGAGGGGGRGGGGGGGRQWKIWTALDRFLGDLGLGYTSRTPLSRFFVSFALFTVCSQGVGEFNLRSGQVRRTTVDLVRRISTDKELQGEIKDILETCLSHVGDELCVN